MHTIIDRLINLICWIDFYVNDKINELTFISGGIGGAVAYKQHFSIVEHYVDYFAHICISGAVPLVLKITLDYVVKKFNQRKKDGNQ